MPASANVDPVIAAMAAAVAYGRESHSPEPQPESTPASEPSKPKPKSHQLGAKKRNWCWNWFTQDPNDKEVALCDYCGRKVRRLKSDRGSPKKLLEHLHTHKITPEVENPARPATPADSGYTAGVQSFYKTITRRKKLKARPNQPSLLSSATTADNPNSSGSNGDEIVTHESLYTTTPPVLAGPSATSAFALRTLRFIVENELFLPVIFSSSFGELVQRHANPEIDEFLRHLQRVHDSEGVSRCIEILTHEARPT